MTAILRHYLPDLEFNLPSLRALCMRLEELTSGADHETDSPGYDNDGYGDAASTTPTEGEGERQVANPQKECRDDVEKNGTSSIQEMQALQEQLGCLMIDSRGNYSKLRHSPFLATTRRNKALRVIQDTSGRTRPSASTPRSA